MPSLNARKADNSMGTIHAVNLADYCPFCHKHQKAQAEQAYLIDASLAKAIFRCTNTECNEVFSCLYTRNTNGHYEFAYYETGSPKFEDFGSDIETISEKFIQIFNEALVAESHNLSEISGVGFRKALEFLIKDYCSLLNKADKEKIIKMTLANVIKTYINEPRIQSIAQRAVWLGNDETHYYRKWEGKTVKDVRKLIELTVYWIKMERLTDSIIKEMPEKSQKDTDA